ncbi:GNAT family N-acetyltransferase [Roseomonas sp. M0104]|uniref:GNAT family N-acetyltransferase n=1 Tax=Teichococcus coralli TaxID=2545983 RepID=A0A845B9U0_9PROT|nr:GNAT family N-acetyltransferase [Pseudoroseomonas coralli]
MLIEVREGPASRPAVRPLFAQVYPDAVLKNVPWRNVVSAPADRRVLVLDDEGNVVAAAGLTIRAGAWNGVPVRIGGIGGVMVSPSRQRQGLGRTVMCAAHENLQSDPCVQFGLLFCEPHNVTFYKALGWCRFKGQVRVEQPAGSLLYDIMQTMMLPFSTETPRAGCIDLRGLPW